MKIDIGIVRRVALLSRLTLTDGELAEYSARLAAILGYISKLNEVDTANTPPTSHAISTVKNVYRKDLPKPSLSAEDALRNAPSRDGDFFKVPQVIENR